VKIDYDLIPNRTIILDWQNNLIVDFGVEYKLSDAWRLRAGLGYQDRVVPESTMSPAMPDMNGWSVGTGVGYQWKDFTFDLSYVYAHGKERWIIDADHGLAGRYSADIHIVSAAVKYNF
jgi:long-subunit fatty acid transport protein